MRNITLHLMTLLLGFTCVQAQNTGDIPIDEVYFPDWNFRTYILDSLDLNHDGVLSETERIQVSEITIPAQYPYTYFESLDGIRLFPNIQSLKIPKNPIITKLDLSGFSTLQSIEINSTTLTNLDLNECSNLQSLTLSPYPAGNLRTLDLCGCNNLRTFICHHADLRSLDLSKHPLLDSVNCSNNKIQSLNVNNLSNLRYLDCSSNELTELNLRYNLSELETLNCSNNSITKLDSLNWMVKKLQTLDCSSNEISYLEVSIRRLFCSSNPLYAINGYIYNDLELKKQSFSTHYIPRNGTLVVLYEDQLPGIDYRKLGICKCGDGYLPKVWSGDVGNIGIKFNSINTVVSYNYVIFHYSTVQFIDWMVCDAPYFKLCFEPDDEVNIKKTFSDIAFRKIISSQIDQEYHLGFLNQNEIQKVQSMPFDEIGKHAEIIDGLYVFTNLQDINVSSYESLKILDLHGCSTLQTLTCHGTDLTSLDLSETINLSSLSWENNGRIVETDAQNRFDLNQLSHLELSNIQNCEGGHIDENGVLTFFQDTVWYDYLTQYTGNNEAIPQALRFFLTSQNPFISLTPENFPDEIFRTYIQSHFDLDHDNILSEKERFAVTEINVNKMGIRSLYGIQHFKKLKSLHADSNHLLCLNLESNILLESLSCVGNVLTIEAENGSYQLDRTAYPDFDEYHIWSTTGGEVSSDYILFYHHYDDVEYLDSITYEYRTDYRGSKIGPQLATFQIINTYSPEEPENPNDPENPNVPDNPDNPNAPDDPNNPNDPDNPDNPNNPNDPDEPNNPTEPDEPEDPDYPWTSVQPDSEAADPFRVHPMPFRHTLHIETALDLKRVSLYNLQGRLCRRYSSGFDALPADGLEPGLYLLLLETADGATYRLKAVKE